MTNMKPNFLSFLKGLCMITLASILGITAAKLVVTFATFIWRLWTVILFAVLLTSCNQDLIARRYNQTQIERQSPKHYSLGNPKPVR